MEGDAAVTLDERLVQVVPAPRQLALQDMEFYAFVHFTVNTFTDREWGDGTEEETVFNPVRFDADQWVEAIKAAGMKGLILTCKHHDGFCLWPSAYTKHTVAASPFRGGQGDVVGEVAAACRRGGIAFGVYLSPWDRNQPLYGTGKLYDDFFVAQLTELLTQYGPIFSVWFDGACGEGPNGRKQVYDWERYYSIIRALQPDACIHVCGPDIRWCGNEAGDTREAEWSVVPLRTRDTEKVALASQQTDDNAFRQRRIRAQDQDLGSRAVLHDEPELIWYPAEVNTSIRPGWFWHASEDDRVRSLDKLIDIYEESVGGNATFLLNIPPTSDGVLHANDVARLHELGAYIRNSYAHNLLDEKGTIYKAEEDGRTITVTLPHIKCIRRVVLMEDLRFSQRVERYEIDVLAGGVWQTVSKGTVIGHKRIAVFDPVEADAVRIRITDVRVRPMMRFIGLYE